MKYLPCSTYAYIGSNIGSHSLERPTTVSCFDCKHVTLAIRRLISGQLGNVSCSDDRYMIGGAHIGLSEHVLAVAEAGPAAPLRYTARGCRPSPQPSRDPSRAVPASICTVRRARKNWHAGAKGRSLFE